MGLHPRSLPSLVVEPKRDYIARLRVGLVVVMFANTCVVLLASAAVSDEPETATQPANGQAADAQTSPDQRTWHLSIINGGQPRGDATTDTATPSQNQTEKTRNPFAESTAPKSGQWQFAETVKPRFDGQPATLGRAGAIPVTGDFNGDGQADIGVFIDGEWFVDLNSNGRWDAADLWAKLGGAGDQPVVGDWDGDGKSDIGVWGAAWAGDNAAVAAGTSLPDADSASTDSASTDSASTESASTESSPDTHVAAPAPRGVRILQRTADGKVRSDAVDHVFNFGGPDAIAVVGDFNGDGIDTIGLFSGGRWLIDTDGDGKWNEQETEHIYGGAGDTPVVGDLNGDGIDEIGIVRNGSWQFDTNNNHVLDEGDVQLRLGGERDAPVVGDFDGDGTDDIGVYRSAP